MKNRNAKISQHFWFCCIVGDYKLQNFIWKGFACGFKALSLPLPLPLCISRSTRWLLEKTTRLCSTIYRRKGMLIQLMMHYIFNLCKKLRCNLRIRPRAYRSNASRPHWMFCLLWRTSWIFDHFYSCLFRLDIDKQALAAPVKNAVDKFQLVPEFLKVWFLFVIVRIWCFFIYL